MAKNRYTIFHNPRCGKSREALGLLLKRGGDIKVIEYLKNPPSLEELEELSHLLGLEATEMLRLKDPKYKALFGAELPDHATALERLAAHPELLQRPIVIKGPMAVIARPAERVDLLG